MEAFFIFTGKLLMKIAGMAALPGRRYPSSRSIKPQPTSDQRSNKSRDKRAKNRAHNDIAWKMNT